MDLAAADRAYLWHPFTQQRGWVEEHPVIVAFAKRKLVPVYGLNYKDTRPAGLGFLSQLGNPYEASLFDGDGRVGIDYGVYGVPETFLIDRQGMIRLKHIGMLTPEAIRDRIEPKLKELIGELNG